MSQLLKRKQESRLCLMCQGQAVAHQHDEHGEEPRTRRGTCVLMGELAGPVVPAAFRGQPVD